MSATVGEGVRPPEEELRVAMALNGGISLAVWMGGCAVEFDRARRAHAGVDPAGRRVYDALCECFGRRLVIDILTGASAGGINGALLGAAIASNGHLAPQFVRDSWLDLGDLSRLLRDRSEEDPVSLMDGKMFYDDLKDAFGQVLKSGPGPAGRGPWPDLVPSLDVTMTDSIGVEKRFLDAWGGEFVAREHRPRFCFREGAHFTAETLAAAARTSASFPIAFEPWPVEGNARILAGLPERTYGIDGGLLDNAPIRAALNLIPTKAASSRVRRYVCYVNGDPALASEDDFGPPPTLGEVGGYLVNLPRTSPLVDHLYAIRDAVERPRWTDAVQRELLGMDIGQLCGVAGALFGTYCERRTVQSLEELFEEPSEVAAAQELLEKTGGRLPWIPTVPGPPPAEGWDWGLRPAQRIIHLLLDLLRPLIAAAADRAVRRRLLDIRAKLDDQLSLLGEGRDHVTRHENENNPSRFDEEAALERLRKAVTKSEVTAPWARAAVIEVAKIFRAEIVTPSGAFGPDIAESLFGSPNTEDEAIANFLTRVLAIEVVRRTFSAEADIESAEKLQFVQLTPDAPTPIFTEAPLDQRSPATADSKLTGVGLGHFAAFYRRSWRANDFMWGRLDAAARIVDLLLDSPSKEIGVGAAADDDERRLDERSTCLADALLSSRLEGEAAWLLEEALDNAAGNAGAAAAEGGDEEAAAPEKRSADELRQEVVERIRGELAATDGAGGASRLPFTRAAFQRAAQLEILAEELEHVAKESATDRKRGSAARPLKLDEKKETEDTRLQGEIRTVRTIYSDPEDSLPKRLTGKGEAVSDLGLRTATHAGLVGLSATRTAGAPMSKVFGVARTPLLSIAGTVASGWIYRLTVAVGFWAAALFLTSRIVTTAGGATLTFETIWTTETLTALVALLGAVGVTMVPGLRAWRNVQPVRNLFYVVALLATAGGLAALLSITSGDLDLERVLFAPDADTPESSWVLLAPLFALGIVSASSLPLPTWTEHLSPVLKFFATGVPMCLLMIVGFGIPGVYAAGVLLDNLGDGAWQTVAAGLALLGAPVAAWLVTSLGKNREAPTKKAPAAG